MGEFRKDLIPDPVAYCQAEGLKLAGAGAWRTTECRLHGGSDSMRINLSTGGWKCMACHAHGGDMLALHQALHGLGFVEAAKDLGAYIEDGRQQFTPTARRPSKPVLRAVELPNYRGLADWAQRILDGTQDLSRQSIGTDYLQARNCVIPPADGDLRFHPAYRDKEGRTWPALVAIISNIATREPMSLQITTINPDLTRGERRNLYRHGKQGGCVRLWPDEAVTYALGIAEGTESALSLAHLGVPVWSLIDAGNMAQFPVLPCIEALYISVDNERTGINAADECALRWHEAGVKIRMSRSPVEGQDTNDVVRGAAA